MRSQRTRKVTLKISWKFTNPKRIPENLAKKHREKKELKVVKKRLQDRSSYKEKYSGSRFRSDEYSSSNTKSHRSRWNSKKKRRSRSPRQRKDKVVLSAEPLPDGAKEADLKDGEDPEGSDYWALRKNNPHCEQALTRNCEASTTFCRVLMHDAPRTKYRVRPHSEKSVLHWGQRKLLMSEIEFLQLYSDPSINDLVVYAGAASGRHITFLSELFPSVRFVLVDPNEFAIRETDKIKIRTGEKHGFFTDATANEFRGKNILFISDIRTANHRKMGDKENEARVLADQKSQMRWVSLTQAKAGMLKFRLPYYPGQTEYLEGKIFLPIWGPQSTTETRLVVDSSGTTKVYDHTVYEEQMFHFNTTARSQCYAHDVQALGLDYCYDCRAEVHLFTEYLVANPDVWLKSPTDKELFQRIHAENPSYFTSHGFKLTGHPGSKKEKKRITPEQYDSSFHHPAAIKLEDERLRDLLMREVGILSETTSSHCAKARTLATRLNRDQLSFGPSNLEKCLASLPKGLAPEDWEADRDD